MEDPSSSGDEERGTSPTTLVSHRRQPALNGLEYQGRYYRFKEGQSSLVCGRPPPFRQLKLSSSVIRRAFDDLLPQCFKTFTQKKHTSRLGGFRFRLSGSPPKEMWTFKKDQDNQILVVSESSDLDFQLIFPGTEHDLFQRLTYAFTVEENSRSREALDPHPVQDLQQRDTHKF